MEKIVKGKKYNFQIEADGDRFFIKAICKISGRYSFINNLNAILSELKIPQNDFRYYDSKWVTSSATDFYKKTVNFLSDKYSLNYVESKLDEDRFYGEWENCLKIN